MPSWFVVPALAIAGAIGSLALGCDAWTAPCAAAAAAASAHAVRKLDGGVVGAILAALLVVASVTGALAFLAIAATAWTIAELVDDTSPPLVALLPATVAAVLEPGCVALVGIAGTRLLALPARWPIAIPIAGAIAVVLAIMAGAARDGSLSSLGEHWYGSAPNPIAAGRSLALLGDALGPMLAVAALAGVAALVRLENLANLAIAACVAGGLLVDIRSSAPGSMTLGLAALCAGVAVGRLGAMIRVPIGQTIVTTTCAMILLVPPAWIALAASR